MATYTKKDYTKDFNSISDQRKKAINAQYNATVNDYKNQQKDLAPQYDEKRSDAYVQARLNARSANEQAAAMGLQRGSGAATSGYSDISRTAQNNALQRGINDLNIEQQKQHDELQRQIIEAGYTRDAEVANALADIQLQKLKTQQEENQYAATAEQNKNSAAYSQALSRAQLLGYVASDADAKILGVKKGTRLK